MHARTMAAVSFVALAAGIALAVPGADGPAGGSLTGYWKLDRDRSDDPDEKVKEAMQGLPAGGYPGSAGGPSGPGIGVGTPGDPRYPTGTGSNPRSPRSYPYGGRSDPRRALLPEIDQPKELLIAQRRTLVLIQEGDDDGSARGVHTDGQRRPAPADRGEVRGHWEGGQLVAETWRNDGLQKVQTFELSSDPRELKVVLTLTAPGLHPVTMTSYYVPDRSKNR